MWGYKDKRRKMWWSAICEDKVHKCDFTFLITNYTFQRVLLFAITDVLDSLCRRNSRDNSILISLL